VLQSLPLHFSTSVVLSCFRVSAALDGIVIARKRNPFAIQLVHGSTGYKQDLTLGVDTGHNEVGLSVVSETKEVFSAVAKMRNDLSKKRDTRRIYRRQKRNKLRYRKPRFLNRAASRRKGRLPPSVQWKVDAHIKALHTGKFKLKVNAHKCLKSATTNGSQSLRYAR